MRKMRKIKRLNANSTCENVEVSKSIIGFTVFVAIIIVITYNLCQLHACY